MERGSLEKAQTMHGEENLEKVKTIINILSELREESIVKDKTLWKIVTEKVFFEIKNRIAKMKNSIEKMEDEIIFHKENKTNKK